jgi:hypothetical protein
MSAAVSSTTFTTIWYHLWLHYCESFVNTPLICLALWYEISIASWRLNLAYFHLFS